LQVVTPLDPDSAVIERARTFAAQLERALTGEDDDLIERSARDLEAAWKTLREEFPEGPGRAAEPAPPPAAGPSGMVSCANCGARLPKGFAFCGKCGMPLKKDTCSACGAALVEGFQFCGKCGAKLE